MDKIVKYLRQRGITTNSIILNITHIDLDGLACTINLKNYFKGVSYFQKNYDNVNQFFLDTLFTGNCTCKNFDAIFVTDISISEDVVELCDEKGIPIVVLDHHATAAPLNKFENCYVDESGEISGAEVVLNLLKKMGYESDKLDKFNRIVTEYDMFLFKRPELNLRRFELCGKKRSLAEMLNEIYFSDFEKDKFVARWIHGWEHGFTKEEAMILKKKECENQAFLKEIIGSNHEVKLDDDKVFVLTGKNINVLSEYYLDELGMKLMLSYEPSRNKISGRVSDHCNINIGKIFDLLKNKFDYVTTGGGHEKAAGCTITSEDYLQEFVEKVVKLSDHYEKK